MTSAREVKPITRDHPLLIKLFAQFFSWIFHPLFLPLYVTWFIAFIHTGYFTGYEDKFKWMLVIRVAVNMVIFPALTVLLLKAVGFISSIFLRAQRERIIPYITSGIFFFWMYLVFRNQEFIPSVLTAFVFGVFLSSSAALIVNIYQKISMHAIGCGGLLGFLIMLSTRDVFYPIALPLSIGLLMTGIVCTSRMIISDHTQKEIYSGLVLGFICQALSGVLIS